MAGETQEREIAYHRSHRLACCKTDAYQAAANRPGRQAHATCSLERISKGSNTRMPRENTAYPIGDVIVHSVNPLVVRHWIDITIPPSSGLNGFVLVVSGLDLEFGRDLCQRHLLQDCRERIANNSWEWRGDLDLSHLRPCTLLRSTLK